MKSTQYLKYALGEIVLVVIGILIALQINDWNEQRKLGIIEDQAIVDLKLELETNISEIERAHTINQLTLDSLQLFVTDKLDFQSAEDKTRIMLIVSGFTPLEIIPAVLSQELGTDKKIKSYQGLTEKLRKLDFIYKQHEKDQSYLDEFWNREFMSFMVDGGHMISFSSPYFGDGSVSSSYIKLYDNPDFRNLISAQGMLLFAVTRRQKSALEYSQEVLTFLEGLDQ